MTGSSIRRVLCSLLSLGFIACGGAPQGFPDSRAPGTPGTPAVCGPCRDFEVCTAAGRCAVDRDRTWVLGVADAIISSKKPSGEAWDAFGGAPDPFVTIGGGRTATVQDSFRPVWNVGERFLAAQLLDQGVTVQVWDEDVAENDAITQPTLLRLGEADFAAGRRTIQDWFGAERITFVWEPR